MLAWLALALVGARALRGYFGSAVDGLTAAAVCDAPIEILDADGVRLGCAGEPELHDCHPTARIGDRVHRVQRNDSLGEVSVAKACRVVRGGMGAPARLLVGLPIDVNRASRADLQLIRGIGPSLATAIVAEREQNGPFIGVDDLERVRGIGPKSVERFRPWLAVEPGTINVDDD